ncbi:Uncharacterised protein [Mycobacteroides abscessus subsp. abscessus]|nr:Uncharacterised protein [Mycobacteroides abscessus subsp. abscessus]
MKLQKLFFLIRNHYTLLNPLKIQYFLFDFPRIYTITFYLCQPIHSTLYQKFSRR